MDTVILKARRLIDGSGSPPIDDAAVVVEGNRIVGVYQGQVPDVVAPPHAEVVEFPDGTLLPGLIDCHVHLNLPGDGTPFVDTVRESDGVLIALSMRNARAALRSGITTLRDCGGRGSTIFEVRRALDLGYGEGPRIVVCGQPITTTGGHTWYFGGEADGVDGVRQKAREMAKLGADFIKVMGSGGGTPGTKAWLPSFSKEEIAAVTDEAHRLGRKISVHCLCAEAMDYAVDAGVDQIEHASFMVDAARTQVFVPAVAHNIARSGIFVTATLAVTLHPILDLTAKEGQTPEERAYVENSQATHEENLKLFALLLDAGVRFVAGTDAGWLFTTFGSLVDEMDLMHEGGLSSLETIASATSRAAEALGLKDKVGTIREGFEADIIAVEGNPLTSLGALRNVRMVMQAGQLRFAEEQKPQYHRTDP